MSPIVPRQAGDAVPPAFNPSVVPPTTNDDSGWSFQAWAIAVPIGILLLLFLSFLTYHWRHRKDFTTKHAVVGKSTDEILGISRVAGWARELG